MLPAGKPGSQLHPGSLDSCLLSKIISVAKIFKCRIVTFNFNLILQLLDDERLSKRYIKHIGTNRDEMRQVFTNKAKNDYIPMQL